MQRFQVDQPWKFVQCFLDTLSSTDEDTPASSAIKRWQKSHLKICKGDQH
jgi:hypothetical protein